MMTINPCILIEKLSCAISCEDYMGGAVLRWLSCSKSPELSLGLGEGILRQQRLMKHQVLHQESVPIEFSRSPGQEVFLGREFLGVALSRPLKALSALLAGENGVPPEGSDSSVTLDWVSKIQAINPRASSSLG